MNPISLPVVPPQPADAMYGESALHLFREFDRSSYLKTFGVQAPPFDPTRRPKAWFDTSSVDPQLLLNAKILLVCLYRSLAQYGGRWQMSAFALSPADAACINLTGEYTYPAWVPAPTVATRGGQPIDPKTIISLEDAQQIATEMGVGQVIEVRLTDFPGRDFHWGAEPQRFFKIGTPGGQYVDASAMLQRKMRAGVGAPGKFQLTASGWDWVPDPQVTQPTDPKLMQAVPVPCRDLLANEQIITGPLNVPMIQRIDLATSPVSASGFTDADRDLLKRIALKLGL